MNEQNVGALYDLLLESNALWPDGDTGALNSVEEANCRDLARFLASRGVLVPSSLTDEECEEVESASWRAIEEDHAINLRGFLEAIAKGDVA